MPKPEKRTVIVTMEDYEINIAPYNGKGRPGPVKTKKTAFVQIAVIIAALLAVAGAVLYAHVNAGFIEISLIATLFAPAAFCAAVCVKLRGKFSPRAYIATLIVAVLLCALSYYDLYLVIMGYVSSGWNFGISNADGMHLRPGPSAGLTLFNAAGYITIMSAYAFYLLAGMPDNRKIWLKRVIIVVTYALSVAGFYFMFNMS